MEAARQRRHPARPPRRALRPQDGLSRRRAGRTTSRLAQHVVCLASFFKGGTFLCECAPRASRSSRARNSRALTGRSVKPELKVGICGEHGGEPRSIAFCHETGLDYVSCSPYRAPVARLAAAQAALADGGHKVKVDK